MSKIMEQWNDRVSIVANLLNPAFCGQVLSMAIWQYEVASKQGMPYSLLPLILPIVLTKRIRDDLPKTTSTRFYRWVTEKEPYFVNFPQRVRELLPYMKESLLFLLAHKWISVDDKGLFHYVGSKNNLKNNQYSDEIDSVLRSSRFLGKWFFLTGSENLIYSYLRIRP